MHHVYVIESISKKRYYIGHTDNLERRLLEHNSAKNRSTKAHAPWKIVYTEALATKQEAYAREMKIKSYKGGRAFKNLFRNNAGGVA